MPSIGAGCAHDVHFATVIFGSCDQHCAQHDAVRSRHGKSARQEMHQEGRTIRSVSRPSNDNAVTDNALCTRDIVLVHRRSATLKNRKTSLIVPAMKRTLIYAALLVCSALPLMAQNHEVGVIVGGSRRFVEGGPEHAEGDFIESNFSLSNNAIDLYWGVQLEPDLMFKIRGGRIQNEIAVPYEDTVVDPDGVSRTHTFRRDVEGEVSHIEGVVEYRFSEVFGSSGLFAGVGYYRQSPDEGDSTNGYGFVGGVNADFPLSRRYGIVVEGAYHWTKADFNARYMTVGGGLRVRF